LEKIPITEVIFDNNEPIRDCPKCKKLMNSISRRHFANILNAQKNTGPSTPESKRRSSRNSAKPHVYHSREARERAAANGFKHGRYAKKIRPFAPANFGKYTDCENCNHRDKCEEKKIRWCPTMEGPLREFLAAYANNSPDLLKELVAYSQAKMFSVFEMGMKDIFEKGALIDDMKVLKNISGGGKIIEVKRKAHPFIEMASEILEKIGFTADQQVMTPAKQENRDDMAGFLKNNEEEHKSVVQFGKSLDVMLTAMKESFKKANEMRSKDDALTEHELTKKAEETGEDS